jgi:hypothetical protein
LDFGRFFFGEELGGKSSGGEGSLDVPAGRDEECHEVVSCRWRVALKAAASLASLDMTADVDSAGSIGV